MAPKIIVPVKIVTNKWTPGTVVERSRDTRWL